jgi:general secretion pathway protein C
LRRSFWAVDLSVAVFCAVIVGHVTVGFLFPDDTKIKAAAAGTQSAPAIRVRQIDQSQIDRLGKNHIFGDASIKSQAVKAPEPPSPIPASEVVVSSLKLEVRGIVWDRNPDLSTCTIWDAKLRKSDVYRVGEEVTTGVTVVEIWPNRIVLNEHGKTTYLEWEIEEEGAGDKGPVSRAATPPAPAPLPRVVEISRAEMGDKIEELMALRDTVQVTPYMEGGRSVGLQVNNLGDNPLAAQIGIEDGDVVQSINSVRIDDMDSAMQQLTKFANQPMVRVGIMRDGQRTFLTYRIK